MTIGITRAKIQLRVGISLLGGFAIPFRGQSVVLFDAFSGIVAKGEHILRQSKSLLGGLSIPFRGFSQIFFDAFAFCITEGEIELRFFVALFRGFFVILYRGFIILRFVCGSAFLPKLFRMGVLSPRMQWCKQTGDKGSKTDNRDQTA